MLLTTTVHINRGHQYSDMLYHMCYHAARLYNVGLYSVRQHFFNTNTYLPYYLNYHECKDNENYKLLLTDTGQQILRLVDRDMKGFFALLKLKRNGKYTEKVRLPRYKDKEGLMMFAVQGRSVRRKGDVVRIGVTKEMREQYNFNERYVEFTIPKNIRHISKFNEVHIVPLFGGKEFNVVFVYDSSENNYEQVDKKSDGYLSIDIGVNNLMACTIHSNGRVRQFLIDGKPLKSINAYYNKMKAMLQEEYSKNKGISGLSTKRFARLSNGRANRIDDYFNKTVSLIAKLCLRYGLSTVVIGYNKGWKDGVHLRKAATQNFVDIPFHKLRQKLQCKCELHGIAFVPQEESYTSKASCLDLDEIPTYGEDGADEVKFSGRRTKRGLYKSKDGYRLNADINGSVNILRKYLTCNGKADLSADSIRALVNAPCQKANAFCSSPLL